ncbi:MAG: hypothetical protein FWE19_05480 [Oscillospiraceae bacterium]|nr:hypothetical protein [Oscillospiraceae bacterium]
MSKYLIRYLIFWAPAILSAYFLTPQSTTLLQVAQWFFGFFMLFGWAMNTGMAAYSYPKQSITFILAYFGVNALLITRLVNTSYSSSGYVVLDTVAGAFTYRPLYMLYGALEASNFREMLIVGIVAGCCVVGFVWGVLHRQVKPDPYRPTFIR